MDRGILSALVAASQDCVKLLSYDGRVEDISDTGVLALMLADRGDVAGQTWSQLWPEPKRTDIEAAVAAAREGGTTRFDGFCPTATGEPRCWDVTVSPVRDADGRVCRILALSRDITHRYSETGDAEMLHSLVDQLEQERARLSKARTELGHVEKLRLLGQFAGGIVHDLNNLLATMSSASSLLRRRFDVPAAGEILNHVDQAVARGSELTRQLLDFSRNETGAAELIDVRRILDTDTNMLRHLVGPEITLTVESDDDVSPILAPSSRVRSVLFNLLANSRDAMDGKGSITVRLKNRMLFGRLRDMAAGRYTVIEIEDDGAGMPPEVVAHLGEAFFTTKPSGKGTGLGMPSAFELAQMCEGEVEIDSVSGRGTIIRLMLGAASAMGESFDALTHRIDPALHGDATILLVENDAFLRDHLAGLLRSHGYTVLEAANATAAIASAMTVSKIDLLLTDLDIDNSSGHDVVAALRRISPDVPVVLLSGTGGRGIPVGEVLLRKPVDERVLAQVLLEQLGRLPARHLTQQLLKQSEQLNGRLQQPAMIAAYDAWRGACRALRRLPSRDMLDGLEEHLKTTGYVVEVAGTFDVPTFRFVTAAPTLEQRLNRPLIGTFLTSGDGDALSSIAQAMARVIRGVAYYDYTKVRAGQMKVRFDRLLLPLSENGVDVTHILGIVTFDEHQLIHNILPKD